MWWMVLNSFSWLPIELMLLLIFPIALFTIMAVAKLIMIIVDIVMRVKGVF